MLGDKYLVAPIITKEHTRSVKLPKGTWKDDTGKKFKGPKTIQVNAPIDRLPYYERISKK
jgi:alpha-glucosidase